MIKINLIPIFYAINNEYGTNELIKRIKKILNIDLSILLNQSLKVEFSNNKVTFIDLNTNIKHIIELDSEYYKYIKDFNTYSIVNFYDMEKNPFRKLASFNTSDDELLVIDEIDEKDMKTRRITKTTKEDTDFIKGSFEKEQLYLKGLNTQERYKFIEDLTCNKKVSKEIEMPDNLYVYSYRTIENVVSSNYYYGYIESSACIDRPRILTLGRIRDTSELLVNSLKTPTPNILIRGRNVIPGDQTEIELYNIYIYKVEDNLQIVLNNVSLPDVIQSREEYSLNSNTIGKLTTEDIDLLIEYLSIHLDSSYTQELKKELLNIKKQILIKKRKEIRDLDFFDGRFLLFNQFEYLVFDVYENLSYYEAMINKSINPDKEDNPPTLRRI